MSKKDLRPTILLQNLASLENEIPSLAIDRWRGLFARQRSRIRATSIPFLCEYDKTGGPPRTAFPL
jgi:hypothetical protein